MLLLRSIPVAASARVVYGEKVVNLKTIAVPNLRRRAGTQCSVAYAQAQWPRLLIYLQDGCLNIDNNLVENAIRPFAVGRRNWLFSDTQHGAQASANLYGLIETAKASHLNDYAYLKYVFAQLPLATCAEDIAALLPWQVDRAIMDAQLNKNGSS